MIWNKVLAISIVMCACTKGSVQSDCKRSETADAVFRYKGQTYERKDLPANVQQSLHEAQKRYHNDIEKIVNQYVTQDYLEDQSKKVGKAPDDVRKELLASTEPTDAELEAYYKKEKERIPYPYEVVKEELRKLLVSERAFEKQNALVANAKQAGDYELLIQPSEAPTVEIDTTNRPALGPEDAPVTIVEFADYRCPHCGKAYHGMKKILKKYEGKVKLVYMDYPPQETGPSHDIAVGAYCAFQKGKFWPYHNMAFEGQATLNSYSPMLFAEALGLDMKVFEECLSSNEAANWVTASRQKGVDLGMTGTPTFYVNGQRVDTDTRLRTLAEAIDAAIKRKR